MQVTTKKEATRIAYFGAVKMASQDYQYRELRSWSLENGELRNGGFLVSAPGGEKYRVFDSPFSVEKRELTCSCPFFTENKAHGVCKHTTKVTWLLKDREGEIEAQAFEDRIADEAAERMAGAECPTRGSVPDKWRAIA